MKPVFQTLFPEEGNPLRGNCFASCIASLIEMPLESVPHVMEHGDWRERTNAWLAEFGLGTVEVLIDTEGEASLYPLPPGMFVIVTGRTERHESRLHSVVAKTIKGGCQWEYLHDPHPNGGFLVTATHLMWIVQLNPMRQ